MASGSYRRLWLEPVSTPWKWMSGTWPSRVLTGTISRDNYLRVPNVFVIKRCKIPMLRYSLTSWETMTHNFQHLCHTIV